MDSLYIYAVCRHCNWYSIEGTANVWRDVCEWDEPAQEIKALTVCPMERKKRSEPEPDKTPSISDNITLRK